MTDIYTTRVEEVIPFPKLSEKDEAYGLGITDEEIECKRLDMKARGLACPHTKTARRRLINERKRMNKLREESEALTTDAVFDWADSDQDEECPVVSVLSLEPL